jgi:hypothetical protein
MSEEEVVAMMEGKDGKPDGNVATQTQQTEQEGGAV